MILGGPPSFEAARAVADAILYEGYLLYPYRRSSGKNRVRWQFGVLTPRSWLAPAAERDTGVAGSADAWRQWTECLLEAHEDATVHMRLRFLQIQHRSVQARLPGTGFEPVDELVVHGDRHLTFDEAVPREYDVTASVADIRRAPHVADVIAPAGEEIVPLGDLGRVVRTCRPVSARVRLSARPADSPFPLLRLRLAIENTACSPSAGAPRTEALRVSLVATHSLLGVTGGSFLSLLDPPEWAAAAARNCRNIHTFPVLAGAEGGRDVLLSSPILMDDHPRVSPESPGDLFDATEIDEILSLRTLTLTEEEKREARATDPRAAAIVDRVEQVPREVLARLHGAVRSPRRPATPETVVVDGFRVTRGSRVRLRPRAHGTDAHDMFLAGRVGVVQAVRTDLDGSRHVAVTIEDDPAADLHEWYGRYHYFAPEEVVPLKEPEP
ncbi:MAG TPA: hypothetical protein VJT49_33920 [Amycolatopsis sp.]|uniref:hypothetical protein n=1 Tax=Amycolatopsis sp. TaxID=37632 RepID=UPI002B45F083|nr:hypothetical protein [Amycolatopsis sp.]HKS50021.1 hypothetical protein [Amycolatopsis sp.]